MINLMLILIKVYDFFLQKVDSLKVGKKHYQQNLLSGWKTGL